MEQLSQHIESLIFTSQGPITFVEIKAALEDSFDTKFKKADIQSAIDEVLEKYKSDVFSFEIVEIANGFQFFTKGAFHGTVGSRLKLTSKKRLSRAALETLAVIAYKQPVTKSECEKIRGVSCDYTIQKLLEKELVAIIGRAETPGRPLLYATSQKFMDYFGLKDISELPKPKDFQLPDQEIGDAAPIEELSEEQRAQKTVALEAMTDQVAAAILGEEFFPQEAVEENEEDPEAVSDEAEEGELTEDMEPEAAIDDEPEDSASGAPVVIGENVSAMSEEEAAALLAADALIETDEEEDNEAEEEIDEAEETMVTELEEELKEIREEEAGNEETLIDEEEPETPSENKFEEEVDAIAAMQAALPLGGETKEVVEETKEEVIEEIISPVIIPSEQPAVVEAKVIYDFSFENEVDAIAAMVEALPQGKLVIGLSEEKLLSSQPIIDKIIEEEEVGELNDSEIEDISLEDLDDSVKKKL